MSIISWRVVKRVGLQKRNENIKIPIMTKPATEAATVGLECVEASSEKAGFLLSEAGLEVVDVSLRKSAHKYVWPLTQLFSVSFFL